MRWTALFLPLALFTLPACQEEDETAEPHDHDDHDGHDHDDHDLDPATEKMTNGGSYMVAYSTMPGTVPLNEDFMVMVQISDMAGASVEPTDVLVDANMPEHGHGMNVVPMMMDMGDGMWHAEGMRFHMEGYWELTVDVDGEMVAFDLECCSGDDAE